MKTGLSVTAFTAFVTSAALSGDDIGILKALGCKNNTIGIVFGLQLLLIAIFTIILSTVGYFFFIDFFTAGSVFIN